MTRGRKWLLGIAACIAAAVIALAVALAWLLYTPSGLHFALDRGVALTRGQFAYAGASGTLAREMTIDGLRYRDGAGDAVRVDHATLALRPWALLCKRLHVARARIDGIALELAPPKPTSQPSNFSLQPPLAIALDDVELARITVARGGAPLVALDDVSAAASWTSRRLAIRRLTVRGPAGRIDLEGAIATTRGWRGSGKATFDWTQAGVHVAGTLAARSDGKLADATATFTAPAPARLAASFALDRRHAWTLKLDAPTFDAKTLPALPAQLQTLALDLAGAGDAGGGRLTGAVTANGHTVLLDPAQFRYDGKTLTLAPLRLRSPSLPGTLDATGSIHLDARPATLALDVRWNDVALPADLVGQPLATHGTVHVEGSTERYAVTGAFALGPPHRLADIRIDLAGTPRAIDLHSLKLAQEHGGLDAHGAIDLQPRVTWRLDAVATRLDPGALFAGWNGALDFSLASRGTLTPRGPEATLKLSGARGTLRGRRIDGSRADLTTTPENLLDGSATLITGGSRVAIEGRHGARTDANIKLDIASLGDWLPDASGNARGAFTLKGAWPRLAVVGQLHAARLRYRGDAIDDAQLTAAVPDVTRPGGHLDATLRGVHAAGFDFDDVRARGDGTAASHHLQLAAHGQQVGAALTLAGSWQAQAGRWSGTLSGVEIAPHALPAWRQQQSSAIVWQRGALTASRVCLSAGAPELCASAARKANGTTSAQFTLAQVPLQLLATLAPGSASLRASGEASGEGQLAFGANGAVSGHATLTATPGSLEYAGNPGRPLLAWTRLDARADLDGATQRLRVHAALAAGGHIDGDATLSGAHHALRGTLDADVRNLAFIEALSPEVANVHGSLAGSLQLAGMLAAPQFQGRIETQGFSAELPRAGLKLHDGDIAVSGDPAGRLAITGHIASGDGVLRIDGSTGLAAGAPLLLTLKGDRVLVADIPGARVIASPDLRVTRADGAFALTGSVAIPQAQVEAEKLPGQGPAQASPDVVIVDAPKAAEVAPLAVNADIEVKLGDAVKLEGYGLDGRAQGQLAVRVRPGQTATGRGEIRIDGKYQAYGQNLTIERGRLLFAGTRLDNPGLDIRAVRELRGQDIAVGLAVRGTAQRPVLTVFSTPAMEQAEALSYLVTGHSLAALKNGESDTLNTAAQALGGLAGDRVAKSIGARMGVEAGVASSEALGGSAFTAGKYLSPRLFLSYGVGLFTPGQVVTLRYTLNRFLQFEAENATTGNRASLNYRIEK